jgi:hypothetical protein
MGGPQRPQTGSVGRAGLRQLGCAGHTRLEPRPCRHRAACGDGAAAGGTGQAAAAPAIRQATGLASRQRATLAPRRARDRVARRARRPRLLVGPCTRPGRVWRLLLWWAGRKRMAVGRRTRRHHRRLARDSRSRSRGCARRQIAGHQRGIPGESGAPPRIERLSARPATSDGPAWRRTPPAAVASCCCRVQSAGVPAPTPARRAGTAPPPARSAPRGTAQCARVPS